jgi:hypothetical protein
VYRVTTFVPPDRVDALLDGIVREVPLEYGRYDRSAWWSAVGVEQFRPLPGAQPTFGEVGRTERVPTVRIEFVIPRDRDLLDRCLTPPAMAYPTLDRRLRVAWSVWRALNASRLRSSGR